jgi:hypothetical protein
MIVRGVMVVVSMCVVLLVAAPAASADTTLAAYCSPTGDYCQGIVRKSNGGIDLNLRTFSFRGFVQICVTRRTRVCHSRRLKPVGHGVYEANARWQRSYPYQGRGRYTVAWFKGGSKIGRALQFRR